MRSSSPLQKTIAEISLRDRFYFNILYIFANNAAISSGVIFRFGSASAAGAGVGSGAASGSDATSASGVTSGSGAASGSGVGSGSGMTSGSD